jgi:two-component system sensor histidine kinase VicK
MPVKRKDGSVFYANISASPIKLAGRICLMGIFRDTTDRKQIENDLENARIAARNVFEDLRIEKEALAHAKAKDEALLESIGEGLIAVDNDRKIMVINKIAADMLGLEAKDLVGKIITDLPLEDEEGNFIPVNKRPTTIALATGKITKITYFFVRKDKTRFPMAITATPIKLSGRTIGLIEIIRDITLEEKIDRTKTEFISIASHQLGTPLIGIQWTIERILKKEKLTIGLQGYLRDIRVSVQRLSSLVSDLLNTSRFEEGGLALSLKQIELVAYIRDYIIECTPLLIKKGLSLTFEEHPETLNIVTDRSMLRNVVQSLVSNAIEYTPEEGKVKVSLEKKDPSTHSAGAQGSGKAAFLFTVSDTGIGIPKKEQAAIFEKFSRASNAKLIKPSGSGLGLYLGKQAVEILGGKIWFESPTFVEKTSAGKEENKGTTFYVELPLEVKSKKGNKSLA